MGVLGRCHGQVELVGWSVIVCLLLIVEVQVVLLLYSRHVHPS